MESEAIEIARLALSRSVEYGCLVIGIIILVFISIDLVLSHRELKEKVRKILLVIGSLLIIYGGVFGWIVPQKVSGAIDLDENNRVYVRFKPEAVTFSDSYLQVKLKDASWHDETPRMCNNKVVTTLVLEESNDSDKHNKKIEYYLNLASTALINNKLLSVGLRGCSGTSHPWANIETLILFDQ